MIYHHCANPVQFDTPLGYSVTVHVLPRSAEFEHVPGVMVMRVQDATVVISSNPYTTPPFYSTCPVCQNTVICGGFGQTVITEQLVGYEFLGRERGCAKWLPAGEEDQPVDWGLVLKEGVRITQILDQDGQVVPMFWTWKEGEYVTQFPEPLFPPVKLSVKGELSKWSPLFTRYGSSEGGKEGTLVIGAVLLRCWRIERYEYVAVPIPQHLCSDAYVLVAQGTADNVKPSTPFTILRADEVQLQDDHQG